MPESSLRLDRFVTLPLQQLSELASEGWDVFRSSSRYPEVPPLKPRLGLLAHTLCDRSFSLMTALATGMPLPHLVRRMVEEAQAARDFYAENGWLADPASYHQRPPRLREVESRRRTLWFAPAPTPLRYQHLRFESGFAPHEGEPGAERWSAHPQNGTAHAYVLEHEGGPRPWLVCVHGFAMGTPRVNMMGFPVRLLHGELGLNLIFPVLPLHGPRGIGAFSGGEVLSPDYVRMVHLFAHAVWDVRRALSWLRGRGASAVGLYGLSLGAYVSALVASLEEGLRCAILGIPAVDFANLARDNEPWIMRRYDGEFELDWQVIRTITHVVSPLALAPRVPHAGRFIYAGVADRVSKPDQARALWRHWSRPAIHWFQGGHVLGLRDKSVAPFLRDALRSCELAAPPSRARVRKTRARAPAGARGGAPRG